MSIDWSKAPEGTTGAMLCHFEGGTISKGDVEFIPRDEPSRELYSEGPDDWEYFPAPAVKPAQDWSGEGLPPVGSWVEVFSGEEETNPAYAPHIGQRVRIVAHDLLGEGDDEGTGVAVYAYSTSGGEFYHALIAGMFRPIRNAEQIAADARLHEVRNACSTIDRAIDSYNVTLECSAAIRATVEAMIDAGYVKP